MIAIGLLWACCTAALPLHEGGAVLEQYVSAEPPHFYELFGWGIAVQDDQMAIGVRWAKKFQNAQKNPGSVDLFRRRNGRWIFQKRIFPNQIAAGMEFGAGISIDGDLMAVTAPGDEEAPGGPQVGGLHIYEYDGTDWQRYPRRFLGAEQGDRYGVAVAASGNTILVGAPSANTTTYAFVGVVNVYQRDEQGVWTPAGLLVPPIQNFGSCFGQSLALKGDTALIGACGNNGLLNNASGAVYVFRRNGSTWDIAQIVSAPDGQFGQDFGTHLDWSGDRMIVGSPKDDVQGTFSGSAYVFRLGPGGWHFEQKLLQPDPGAFGVLFGLRVQIEGDVAVVAGQFNQQPVWNQRPRVWIYRYDGTQWALAQVLYDRRADNKEGLGWPCMNLTHHKLYLSNATDSLSDLALTGSVAVYRLPSPPDPGPVPRAAPR